MLLLIVVQRLVSDVVRVVVIAVDGSEGDLLLNSRMKDLVEVSCAVFVKGVFACDLVAAEDAAMRVSWSFRWDE